jgi:hypothetical protein
MFRILFLLGVCAGLWASPALAQEKSATKPGFTLDPGSACIVLFRPSITVGAQSAGGAYRVNADWTAQARDNIGAELAVLQDGLGNQVVPAPELFGNDAEALADYNALFGVIAESVINYKFFVGNRLPTKKRDGVFDWTMGSGVARLAGDTGCKYGLFIFTEDQIGSTGRKALQIVAMLASVSVKSGEHKGYAGLIDLRSGDLVWLNADMAMGGDVRTREGANKRVTQLLEDFPGRPPVAANVSTSR